MANLVAEYGTDIEIHIKALSVTIQADTPTGAPAALHALLEQLGLEHHEHPQTSRSTSGTPCPDHLGADEQKAPGDPCHPRSARDRIHGQL
ncbi:hypothetical protein ACFV1X_21410 [Streptomyces coelicoflavus]|uniref:hypothetical protein n=1 Tax=Streptomyces coelicoflavus TaxID=285562 RepID=UPI0036908103